MNKKMENKKLIELRKKLKGKKPKFIRKDSFKKLKIGKSMKKKRKWRRPRGRHSKIREKRKSYMRQPSIGWSFPKKIRGTIEGFKPVVIHNVNDLDLLKENEVAIIGKIGKKKKIEIVNAAIAKNIKLINLNAKKFVKKIKFEEEIKKIKKTKEKEERREGKKIIAKEEIKEKNKEEKNKEKELEEKDKKTEISKENKT